MAIVYAQNVVEVAIRAKVAGREHVNVLHLHNDEGAQSDAAKVRDLANNWQDHVLPQISGQYALMDFAWRSLDPDDQNVGVVIPDPAKAVIGGAAGPILPPSSCFLIKKQTANRPRGRRDGRIYISGVPETSVDDAGAVSAGHRSSLDTAFAAFLDGVSDDQWGVGGGSGLCVLETTPASRQAGTAPVTITWRAITGFTCDQTIAHQRDRVR